jgi:hypothetical protein
MKTVVSVILLLFVLASVAYLVFDNSDTSDATTNDVIAEQASSEIEGDQVLVYYFHGEVRCPTCIKIEALSTEAVQAGFAEEIGDGRLVWQVVNIEQPENEHFVDDYELYTKSVIVVKQTDGQQVAWKNLPEIWELVDDDAAFIKYVNDEVKAYLGDV